MTILFKINDWGNETIHEFTSVAEARDYYYNNLVNTGTTTRIIAVGKLRTHESRLIDNLIDDECAFDRFLTWCEKNTQFLGE